MPRSRPGRWRPHACVSPRTDGDVHLGHGHALPATPELVVVFLAELGEEGKSVATLRLTKSALAAVHRSPRPHR